MNVLLVGLGRWGENHLRVLSRLGVTLWVADVSPARLDWAVRSGVGPGRVVADYRVALARVDAADIVTPAARAGDAFALAAARRPLARLLVVGARDPRAFHDRAALRGVRDRVLVLGYRDDVPEILAGSDCCVDASYAGLGVTGTLREALAVETAVIASNLEGNPELVIDGRTGLLFPPRDVAALAATMLRMIDDRELVETTAREGRKLVEARFSSWVKLDAIEALYRRLRGDSAT
jgi:Glycosyl transferases group 1